MTQMITVSKNKEQDQTTQTAVGRVQAHKGEPRRTSKRWLDETQTRHIANRVETKELRRIQFVGRKNKHNISKQHYYNISVSKNYCKDFGLGKGDMFMWSVTKKQPLTFTLTQIQVNLEGDSA